jgi:hypothetical protein
VSAAAALKAAYAASLDIRLDGGDLVLKAPNAPPANILELLSRNKVGVVALLRSGRDGWSAFDWKAYYDDRLRIATTNGNSPAVSVMQAFACCVAEWLHRNPIHSSTERCLECEKGDSIHSPLVPVGIAGAGEAWLHHSCITPWQLKRRAEAVTALSQMGITSSSKSEKPEARDGRLRIGKTRIGARHRRSLPLN